MAKVSPVLGMLPIHLGLVGGLTQSGSGSIPEKDIAVFMWALFSSRS